jgi:hypothetical protein
MENGWVMAAVWVGLALIATWLPSAPESLEMYFGKKRWLGDLYV